MKLFKKKEKTEETEKKPNVLDKAIGIPKRCYRKCYDWLWGTEEKPLYPLCMRAKFSHWFKVRYRGYCFLYTTEYAKEYDEYTWEKTIIKKKDLPDNAVPVTNEKYSYHMDMNLAKRGFSTVQDHGFTAADAWLYIKCNKINDAMKIHMDGTKEYDMNKMILLAGVGAAVVIGVYLVMMP